MPIDPATALGAEQPPVTFSWTPSDVLRYHLAIGATQLRHTYERDLVVLPTFATVAATVNVTVAPVVRMPGIAIDLAKVVHGSQAVTVHRPLPPEGTATARTRVIELQDKGSAAVVVQETAVTDAAGSPLWTARSAIFARGEGGFGGERGHTARTAPPDGAPDTVLDTPTLPQQALLYRLCGDRNPLHVDPEFAARAGFDAPILHGLCSYGMVARAVAEHLGLDGFTAWSARFAGTVFPGQTLRSAVWRDGGTVHVATTCAETGKPVLDNGILSC